MKTDSLAKYCAFRASARMSTSCAAPQGVSSNVAVGEAVGEAVVGDGVGKAVVGDGVGDAVGDAVGSAVDGGGVGKVTGDAVGTTVDGAAVGKGVGGVVGEKLGAYVIGMQLRTPGGRNTDVSGFAEPPQLLNALGAMAAAGRASVMYTVVRLAQP